MDLLGVHQIPIKSTIIRGDMPKIAFIGNGRYPTELLTIFKKMTPGRLGIWGQLIGTDTADDADYFAVIDRKPHGLEHIPDSKCVYLGAHPETLLGQYQNMDGIQALAKYDAKKTVGFLEWWIKYDYDYLSGLQPITKTKRLATIVSNSFSDNSHKVRKAFLDRMCSMHPGVLDIYGRIIPFGSLVAHYKGVCGQVNKASGDYWSGKEPVYEQYKYVLEFDNEGGNYFSERILDCMLLWAMPIYWGGRGMHKVLPENSFRYLNINGRGDDAVSIINSGFYEEHLPDLTKARDILLNELQLWPRVHKAIFGVYK